MKRNEVKRKENIQRERFRNWDLTRDSNLSMDMV